MHLAFFSIKEKITTTHMAGKIKTKLDRLLQRRLRKNVSLKTTSHLLTRAQKTIRETSDAAVVREKCVLAARGRDSPKLLNVAAWQLLN
jgi:hypothetical protein